MDILAICAGILNIIRAYHYYELIELCNFRKPESIWSYLQYINDRNKIMSLFLIYPVKFWEYGELKRKALYVNLMTWGVYLLFLGVIIWGLFDPLGQD